MSIRWTSFFLALLWTAGSVSAGATTINFSSLSQAGSSFASVGGSITQQGFTFNSADAAFYVWQASSANLPSLATANTSLFEYYAFSTTTLTDGGNPFSLNSIDLAPLLTGGSGTFTVTFTGMHPDTTTVSQTFTVNDTSPPSLQTFLFSGFANLVSVSYAQGTNSGFFQNQVSAYQFDNVVVVSASSVPESASLALLGSGVLSAAGALRRKFMV
jgi:hypothetical protein